MKTNATSINIDAYQLLLINKKIIHDVNYSMKIMENHATGPLGTVGGVAIGMLRGNPVLSAN